MCETSGGSTVRGVPLTPCPRSMLNFIIGQVRVCRFRIVYKLIGEVHLIASS